MRSVRVLDTYDVGIGPAPAASDSSFIISDENVWPLYGGAFDGLPCLVLPAGEETKSPETWARCVSWLSQSGADRSSTVIALGGGVIGDLAGFAAATFMRGVRFVNIATSLIAQVDASIGGKTGVDLPEGKNLAGAFYQPGAVWCDPRHLSSLPDRQFCNGMAEVLKYGFIMDTELLGWLSEERPSKGDADKLEEMIFRCCTDKAAIVNEDPLEQTGRRSILNFGHTVGHALEQALGYRNLLHGEAVMIGMVAEAAIGEKIGVTTAGVRARVEEYALRYSLPTVLPGPDLVETIMAAMRRDKKAQGGRIAMALLKGIGESELAVSVDESAVREVLCG
jgi:3-dehydroquinate synthase